MEGPKGAPPPYGPNVPPYQPNPPPAQPVVVTVGSFGPDPSRVVCPSCHAQITTRTATEATTKTHLFALILCLICCPLVVIPYCTDSCQSIMHYCPSCGAYLGAYDK